MNIETSMHIQTTKYSFLGNVGYIPVIKKQTAEHQPHRHQELCQPLHSPFRGQISVRRYKYQYTDVERDVHCPEFNQLLDECAGANLTAKRQDTEDCLRTK